MLTPAFEDEFEPGSLKKITIGESKAEVYSARDRQGKPVHLKLTSFEYAARELRKEKDVLNWLVGKLPAPRALKVLDSDTATGLIMSTLPGNNLADSSIDDSERLALGARFMRRIHSISVEECPFDRRLSTTLRFARENLSTGLIDPDDFDEGRNGRDPEQIYEWLLRNKPGNEDSVFTHGDFCLPNVFSPEGAVDWGRAGIADRYQDIALFLRSFERNCSAYSEGLFVAEYGLIQELDPRKIEYYKCLDEFF